jgi:acetylornithine deacetylase
MGAFEELASVQLNEPRFLELLEKLIGESQKLQNNPERGLVPREDCASDHVLDFLRPYTQEHGGVLKVERISFVEGRGNVIVTYPGTEPDRICSFVGSHLDVVPAIAADWERDPFKLSVEGDLLYGRGTTDCLGHVAVTCDLLASLAEKRVELKNTLVVIFIANEENAIFHGVGVDQLAREGYMDPLLRGPLFWIDAADTHPCMGTCGMLQWKLKVKGKLFHSGMQHRGINAVEMAMDAVSYCQERFFKEFPRHEKEDEYKYVTQSSMKATQMSTKPGSLNQIPADCTVEGDIRLAPFYDVTAVRAAFERWVGDINADPSILENVTTRGPHSKYTLPAEKLQGEVQLTWTTAGENGIACRLDSKGFHALTTATQAVLGEVKPYSIGGSLPLVNELQSKGFDVQITGYGMSSRYHADNEAASLTDMRNAVKIMSKVCIAHMMYIYSLYQNSHAPIMPFVYPSISSM